MRGNIQPNLSHVGIFVKNIEAMEKFYATVFDLVVTDRGTGAVFKNMLVFMSGNPEQHHQLVLSTGRADDSPSTVMQLSFMVPDLDALRSIRATALDNGADKMIGLNHGNAWSIYFDDPEQNKVEVYVDTPFHTPQPCGQPLNLDLSNEALLAETEALVTSLPGFMPRADYVRMMADRRSG